MFVKALIVWVCIAIGEILNGNIRVRYLQNRYGKSHAKIISLISGIVIFSIIIWFSLSWVGPANISQCMFIGFIWMVLMVLLDLYFGRYVFLYSWRKIANDFNPKKGNFLGVGMLLILFLPGIIFIIQRQH
jgi:hypothetical protein